MQGARIVSQMFLIRAIGSLVSFFSCSLDNRSKYHSHRFPDNKHKCLVCDLIRIREEEERQRYVE